MQLLQATLVKVQTLMSLVEINPGSIYLLSPLIPVNIRKENLIKIRNQKRKLGIAHNLWLGRGFFCLPGKETIKIIFIDKSKDGSKVEVVQLC